MVCSPKRQSSTALLSCEAEYIGQTQATEEAIWPRGLLTELQVAEEEGHTPVAPVIYGDDQGAIALARNPQFHARTKHIDVQHHFVRERQHSSEVDLQYIPTDQQVAVNNGFKQELAAIAAEYKQITDTGVPAVNALLKQNGVAVAIAPDSRVP